MRLIHSRQKSTIHRFLIVRTIGRVVMKLLCMTATSSPIVLTRAKARAMGIPLSDLLGRDFTRLFHDTYVVSGQMMTLRLRARTIMKRLPAATQVSHHTAVRLWGGVAPDSADIHVSMASREARCRRAGVAAHVGMQGAQTTVRDGIKIRHRCRPSSISRALAQAWSIS